MSESLFSRIAPYYGVFFSYQKRHFNRVLDVTMTRLELRQYSTVLDVGCGTGALCAALMERGFIVTGVDPVQRMLKIARKRVGVADMFLKADAVKGLPFDDNSFDIAIASYVAHGLPAGDRELLYREMARVTRHLVIIHDFNQHRSPLIDLVETLEGGDYFSFIEVVRQEMEGIFAEVQYIDVGPRATWYIGKQ